MGMKAVEMQVALPRTQDAGKMQDQMQRHGETLQGMLAQSELEAEKLKRTQVQHMVETNRTKKKEESEQERRENKKQKAKKKTRKDYHPYLGRRIDFNG